MTVPHIPERDRDQVDALVADRYLDDLLAAGDRHANAVPADAGLDPELRETARALRGALVRVHPSFRFEERLAARLGDLAAMSHAWTAEAPRGGLLLPFRAPVRAADPAADPLLRAVLTGALDPSDADAVARAERAGTSSDRRPLIVGGAITSAAISIVGVAWVAWRASHSGSRSAGRAMGRAARTAHARRAERIAALAGAGLGGPA
ncbi:MAG: hypothetical protein WCK58_11840 [Chloroflexota bacterium]